MDIILENHPGDSWVYTNDRYSFLDGLFVRGGVIKAVAEIKSRECELGHHPKEMIGWNKMEAGQWASKSFRCPFYLFAYHPVSEVVAVYKLTNEMGNFIRAFDVSDYGQNKNKDERETKIPEVLKQEHVLWAVNCGSMKASYTNEISKIKY